MKPLSTEYTDNLTFAQMLMGIIRIVGDFTADEEDLLRICSTCESDLITAYNFKTICQTTETILSERKIPQKILKQIETEILKNDDCSSIDNDGIKLEPEIITTLPPTVDLALISNVKQPKKRGRKPKVKTSTDNEDLSKGPVKPDELAYTEDEPEVLVSGNATDQMPTPTKRKYDRRSTVGKVTAEKKTKPRHRKATPQSIWCRRCDITFDTGQLYQQHYKKVHQYKSPCSLCGKTFYTYDLDKHITTHSTEKFTCTVCGNRLKNKNSLREHMRIHTGEKRYKCDFCDERFIHWNSKKCHMYVKHTHERKSVELGKCSLCCVNRNVAQFFFSDTNATFVKNVSDKGGD